MKEVIILATLILLSTTTFAATTAGTDKQSKEIHQALGAAWKSHPAQPKQDQELAMVYGGEDVSSRVMVNPRNQVAA